MPFHGHYATVEQLFKILFFHAVAVSNPIWFQKCYRHYKHKHEFLTCRMRFISTFSKYALIDIPYMWIKAFLYNNQLFARWTLLKHIFKKLYELILNNKLHKSILIKSVKVHAHANSTTVLCLTRLSKP